MNPSHLEDLGTEPAPLAAFKRIWLLACQSEILQERPLMASRVQVSHPTFRCNGGCGSIQRVHPIAMGCFPATPSMPRVYFSEALLTLTHNVRLAGPLAMRVGVRRLKKLTSEMDAWAMQRLQLLGCHRRCGGT